MIIVREKTQGKRIYYERIVQAESAKFASNRTVHYRLARVEKDGYVFFVLYDDNMVAISDFFRYVNIELKHYAYNTREQAAHSLRLLYCYLELTKLDINNLRKHDIINLQFFLLGYSPKKGAYSFELTTKRKNNTVNSYIDIYRSYLKYIGITCEYLETKYSIEYKTKNVSYDAATHHVNAYKSSLKEGTPVNRVPRYINVDDFGKVINIIRNDHNVMAEIIVRLMYEYGLRIGEVLGLTSEDVTEKSIDGTLRPVIYIRNRVSDNKKFQNAKTLMNVNSSDVYKSPNYMLEKLGYAIIYITDSFYELVNDYIEKILVTEKEQGREHKSIADSVIRAKYAPENHYIFLNSLGVPISVKTWNKYLKTVFYKANIDIDHNVKRYNLNHRFRHGFAMFQIQYCNINVLELKEMMRHNSISSTMSYYNPTESDEYKIKTEFVNDLYELIPSLRERPRFYEEENI